MPVIKTHEMDVQSLDRETVQQVYCGLDNCVTFEVFEKIYKLCNQDPVPYTFSRAVQAPALEMMLRGWKVDELARQNGIRTLKGDLDRLYSILNAYAEAVTGWPPKWHKGQNRALVLNPASRPQMIKFFYGGQVTKEGKFEKIPGIPSLNLLPVWTSKKGQKKLSMDREALEKLEVYFFAMPIVAVILEIREKLKQVEMLETEVDHDGRMRSSYNIVGTETGRWSSSANAWGTGGNLQNIAPGLRNIFIADQGWKLCGIDLEQAESREVGLLCGTIFGDWAYLDACEGGDLHTFTCKLIWPGLGWTGDKVADRKLADQTFYREFSYRDMSKRGGHGCLTADHEVLTPEGWVSISEKPKKIMTWRNGNSEFEFVSNWIDKEYEGNFICLEGRSVSINMTADHRVYAYLDVNSPVRVFPAEKLPKRGAIPLGEGYLGGNADISVPIARLIAAFQCDGYQKSTNRVEFHFHKIRKFMRLEMLAIEANIPFEKRGDKANLTVFGWPKKAGKYLLDWPKAALLAYIEEHRHWDGHIGKTSVQISSVDKEHLDWIRTLGRLLGIGGNFQRVHTSGFGSLVYQLQQNNRKYADIASLFKRTTVASKAQVYCPTVYSGAFYIRRNGMISVTGNSNYYGTPWTMARHLKVPTSLMEDFQREYFRAFPAIPRWHRWVAEQLQTIQCLTTRFEFTRHFFGRPNDDTTLRAAIASTPQSNTAFCTNLGLWRIWRHMGTRVQILHQNHDAVYFMYKESDEAWAIPEALRLMEIETYYAGRKFIVPGEAKIGWNWGYFSDKNPNGLVKWKGPGKDTRVRVTGLARAS